MIAVIDCHVDPEDRGAPRLLRQLQKAATQRLFAVYHALDSSLPHWKEVDAIVISGSKTSAFDQSPWVVALEKLLAKAHQGRLPILGICFGHQLLIRAIYGKENLCPSKNPERGWITVQQTTESLLWKGIDPTLWVPANHGEEVTQLPPQARILARSTQCDVQAFHIEASRTYGVQFHPEKADERPELEGPCLQILKNFLESIYDDKETKIKKMA